MGYRFDLQPYCENCFEFVADVQNNCTSMVVNGNRFEACHDICVKCANEKLCRRLNNRLTRKDENDNG